MRAIDKILNKLGYYKPELPKGSKLSEKEVMEMFASYGENETFTRFLRDLCDRDIQLYFKATNDFDRSQIRGAHSRTYYFLSLIKKTNEQRQPRNKQSNQNRV